MPGMLANQKNCLYQRREDFQLQFRGSTIGFFGYGGIGRETARIAKAMGVTVWGMAPNGKARPRPDIYCIRGVGDPKGVLPDRMFSPDQFEEFMPHLDYLVIAAALTETSKDIIGAKELNLLKPSAVVINSARAAIIQEQPLIQCLREGRIRGASIDALYNEPLPPESPWWSMDNTIITSHIAGDDLTTRFTEGIFGLFGENLKRYIAGKTLLNELTTEQLQGN
jgi:phosphoglycerate dehydrogenase-like enzyme